MKNPLPPAAEADAAGSGSYPGVSLPTDSSRACPAAPLTVSDRTCWLPCRQTKAASGPYAAASTASPRTATAIQPVRRQPLPVIFCPPGRHVGAPQDRPVSCHAQAKSHPYAPPGIKKLWPPNHTAGAMPDRETDGGGGGGGNRHAQWPGAEPAAPDDAVMGKFRRQGYPQGFRTWIRRTSGENPPGVLQGKWVACPGAWTYPL